MTQRLTVSSLFAAAALAGASSIARADLSNFTVGDLVVIRTGDATTPDSTGTSNEVPVYLDEYSPTGTLVGSIAVPSTGANALTLPGVADDQHQGVLSLSTDGSSITFAGYNTVAGAADSNSDATTGKRIGIVNIGSATVNTSTVVNSYGAGSSSPYIRGAVSNNGTQFWTFGKYAASGATSNGGLAYVSGTGATATTTTVEGFADWRDITIANGQLYGGTGSSSVGNHGPYQVSTGEPTTNLGTSLTNNTQLGNYPGGQSASALSLLHLPTFQGVSDQNGVDVMYTIGDQSTAGIVKYYFNGTTWVNQTNVELAPGAADVANPTGLSAVEDPTNPNWVDIAVSGTNGIYTYVDKSGPTGAIPADAFTQVVAAPTGEQFRGLVVVPEPTSLSLLTLGATALIGRRRKSI